MFDFNIIKGIAVGLIYILLIYLTSSIAGGNFALTIGSMIMILIGILCGAIGGIIGVNIG